MSSRKSAPLLVLFLALAIAPPFQGVQAARRLYLYPGKIGSFVPKLIDGLADEGFRFSVGKVFNYERDGREGFQFEMKPARTLCEITFADGNSGTVVTLFTQDPADLDRLGRFFTRSLGMTEVGLAPEPESEPPAGETWPLPRR
jgi:hypothetical protein